ncbi:MAG: hypothetical protein KJ070_23910 [Verrucomicrobia bacterium]|nr:hypothetical protein [Verrucomicrobiota bacterium]
MKSHRKLFKMLFDGRLEAGVNLSPSLFEAGLLSAAHTKAGNEKTVAAATKAVKVL